VSLTGLTTRCLGLGFIDREHTAHEILAAEPDNRGMGRLTVRHLHESKAFAAASVAVRNDTDGVHYAIRLKELAEVVRRGGDC
jgi:hypothetical protein